VTQDLFRTADVARVLGVSAERVRAMVRAGWCRPDRAGRAFTFRFQDLVLLRTAHGLTVARVPPRRVKRALTQLQRQLPADRPLSGVRISAEAGRVVVRDRDSKGTLHARLGERVDHGAGLRHQLHVVPGGPAGDLGMLVRGEVVADHIQLVAGPAGAEQLEERQELPPALALADPVGYLPGGQVEGGDQARERTHGLAPIRPVQAMAGVGLALRGQRSLIIQKISSALPGDGSAFGDEAPAKSVAPTKPTTAARSAPTRRKFKPMSEVTRQVRLEAWSSRKHSSSAFRMAARPSEARTIQHRVRARHAS
jgi:hypothetical protein